MIETSVMYVSTQTSVNVLRIAPTATATGIRTAGSVPKTKRRITIAPRPPTRASTRTLPLPPPCELASSSGSCPVTSTLTPDGHPRGGRANVLDAARRRERRRTRRVDLFEGRVPVLGDVHEVVRREIRACPGAGHCRSRPLHRGFDRTALRRVTGRAEDDDVRRPDPGPERLQRALVRLVGGLTRDREALVPPLRDLARGEHAEERERDPGEDDLPPVTGDDVCETSQHGSPSEVRYDWRLQAAPELVGQLAA